MILLLLLSLGLSSVIPQGLMIAKVGQGPWDLGVILCDGSKGLGSVPALQKKQMPGGHLGHATDHAGSHHESALGHHGEDGGCADCDLTWASGLSEDVVLDTSELQFSFNSQQLFVLDHEYTIYLLQFYSYNSRAPPPQLIA